MPEHHQLSTCGTLTHMLIPGGCSFLGFFRCQNFHHGFPMPVNVSRRSKLFTFSALIHFTKALISLQVHSVKSSPTPLFSATKLFRNFREVS